MKKKVTGKARAKREKRKNSRCHTLWVYPLTSDDVAATTADRDRSFIIGFPTTVTSRTHLHAGPLTPVDVWCDECMLCETSMCVCVCVFENTLTSRFARFSIDPLFDFPPSDGLTSGRRLRRRIVVTCTRLSYYCCYCCCCCCCDYY